MSRAMARLALLPLAFAGIIGLSAQPAAAEPGPVALVSKNAVEQADFAVQPAISANGRYVAFRGSIGGLEGVFRKDLQTGAVVPVVAASAYASPPPPETGASEPSISAEGRYVSFTTTSRLDPVDDQSPSSSDVYVADMADPLSPTYELASARDKCDPGASTEPCGLEFSGGSGAIATGRVSLSGDGREVVFVTTAVSNLGGTAGDTPAGQVVVRDLATDRTTLISAVRNAQTDSMEQGTPVPGGAVASNFAVRAGASLSADGSTVAWLGDDLGAQVPVLADEHLAAAGEYVEPLWRRVPAATDPTPPRTRRIVGGGDPLAPGCPTDGTLDDAPCRGPFPGIATGENAKGLNEACLSGSPSGWDLNRVSASFVPQLSADGRKVALLGQPNGFTNVFLVDMHEGLSRLQAMRQLTREIPTKESNICLANDPENLAGSGDITSVAISPAGDRVAFTTQRQQFPLAPPNLIGSPPAAMGLAELYVVDIERETLQRLTHGASGGEPSKRLEEGELNAAEGAVAVSFDASGETLAFSSRASNLVPGDGNGESLEFGDSRGSDAFIVAYPHDPAGPGASAVSPPPGPVRLHPRWRLTVSTTSRPDGGVRLAVEVPGAGRLRARATATTHHGLSGTVSRAAHRAREASVLVMLLEPPRRYRRLVDSSAGLEARLDVGFLAPGKKPLKAVLSVRFRRHSRTAGRTR